MAGKPLLDNGNPALRNIWQELDQDKPEGKQMNLQNMQLEENVGREELLGAGGVRVT